uniref:Saposin B-type domain-containing protein n=1 Tax=Ascaris lumbricoides TaxID=6252 RepID=A0A0M3IGK6_ASCLU
MRALIILLICSTLQAGIFALSITDLRCMICAYRSELLEHLQSNKRALCSTKTPPSICNALYNSTQRYMRIYGEQLCQLPCPLYSPELTCGLCNNLMKLAITITTLPLEIFEQRLRHMCSELEFLDPPCNMIVDEYRQRLQEVAIQKNDPENACATITLCT